MNRIWIRIFTGVVIAAGFGLFAFCAYRCERRLSSIDRELEEMKASINDFRSGQKKEFVSIMAGLDKLKGDYQTGFDRIRDDVADFRTEFRNPHLKPVIPPQTK